MYKICVCDDNVEFSFNLEEMVLSFFKEMNIKCDIDVYNTSKSLLFNLNSSSRKEYQIYFLDMEIDDKDGIDIAKEIREVDKDCLIIYVTIHEEYAIESFSVLPFRYLVKPISVETLL